MDTTCQGVFKPSLQWRSFAKTPFSCKLFRNNSEKLSSTYATDLGSIPAKKRQFFVNCIFKVSIDFKGLQVHTTDNILLPEFTERSYINKHTAFSSRFVSLHMTFQWTLGTKRLLFFPFTLLYLKKCYEDHEPSGQ